FFNLDGGCMIDGVASSCGLAMGALNSGAADQCPNNECTRYNPNLRNGQGGIEHFHSYGDGYSGYEPPGARYLGHGSFIEYESQDELAGLGKLHHSPQNTGSLAPNGLASDRRLTDAECDKRLAQIFGGAGAVVGSTRDPLTVGSNPNALAYAQKYGLPTDRIGERGPGHGPVPYDNPDPKSGDRGGIIHIFGNAEGTPSDTPLYAPSGGSVGAIAKDSQNNLYRHVSYGTGLTITFMHVIPGGGPGRDGSVLLGTIGGPDSGGDNYRHSHLIFYSNFAKGIRVDPRKVFCGQ